MGYQTLTLEYAHQIVSFPEMFLIFSDWHSFNKVDVDAISYLSNTKIPIRLPNVRTIKPDCAEHLIKHKGFLEIGVLDLTDELLAKSFLNGRDHLVFSKLKKIAMPCYKYFELQNTYIHFKVLNHFDDKFLISLSQHKGGLSFDKIKNWNRRQLNILKSLEGEISLSNQM